MNGLWWLAALGALVGLGVGLEIAERRMSREHARRRRHQRWLMEEIDRQEETP